MDSDHEDDRSGDDVYKALDIDLDVWVSIFLILKNLFKLYVDSQFDKVLIWKNYLFLKVFFDELLPFFKNWKISL